ncbi:methyl-accepting chemotaxis sensory transducer [Candidatus Moduliflexus flocculans]|uniref:Methyl-accepting chemotaxis sensory transducer n=1 Tax=Candidatus Moduliflexus flocculans TaxID=1499966 RepID=A0A0S6VWX9_9BACT|nr:methyl-accepting chemotaxis sensory transducer [Candidatus Moduliflexus flocculans]
MKIQMKLSVFIGSLLFAMVILMVAIGTWVINAIIYELNTGLLSLKLAAQIEKIDATIKLLEDSGATGIAAYVQQAQTEILQKMSAETESQTEGYYVLAVKEQKMLFQSKFAQDESQAANQAYIQQMLAQKSGTLDYEQAGVGYFTVFKYFETWDWLIGVTLPKTIMFRQRQSYLISVGWASLIVFVALLALSYVMGRKMIVQPVTSLVKVANSIADGQFEQVIDIRQRDEIGSLARAFHTMQTTIQRALLDLHGLIQAIQAGQLSTRSELSGYAGNWRELMVGVNNLLDALVTPINTTANYIERLSNSEIPEQITAEYCGDFNKTKQNLNLLGSDIRNVIQAIRTLSQAIQDGQLDARGDVSAFGGGWRELVSGVNQVVDAFTTPVTVAIQTIERIAKGDVPELITAEYRGDFNTIKKNVNQLIIATQEITSLAEEMARGNFTREVQERSEQDTLMRALNSMSKTLQDIVVQIKVSADNVAISSQQMNVNAAQMSEGAANQSASTEQASASMEQMTTNIRQNADNAVQAEKIARQSVEYAEEGARVVRETVTAMQEITKKIMIIQEIAQQTRLLSLNATIEAARAQEHGKAFSVVAAEVRKLSDITKDAAEEIDTLANSSRAISERAGEMLTKLVPNIQTTSDLVQEISAASSEQSMGAEQVNRAIQQLDQVTQENAETADELAATAEELAAQARQLQKAITFFHVSESAAAAEVAVPGAPPTPLLEKKHDRNMHDKTPHRRHHSAEKHRSDSIFHDELDNEFEHF